MIGALRVTLGINTAAFTDGLKQAQTKLAGVGRQMTSAGKAMSVGLTTPITIMGGLIIKTAGDFEASMNRIGAATGASNDEMKAFEELARELGKTTTFSAVEAANAIETLAKNGVSTADIMGGTLVASLELAAASGSDLSTAADLATDTMLNFKKGSGDLRGVVDGVSGVLLESKFGFDDYRMALAQAGGVAGGLGVTLDDFNAVIAATSASFASGSDAGTSFKTFLQRLAPSTAGAAAAMDTLGLSFFDAQGNMRSMAEIAQELKEGFVGLSDEAKSEALTKIFGTDAMRTAIGLMEQGAAGVRELDASIKSASAADQAAARTKGWAGALEQLGGAFDELKLAIASSGLLEMATSFVQALTKVANTLSTTSPALLRFGVVLAGLAAAAGPVLIALGGLAVVVGAVGAPVVLAVAGIVALGAALVAFWPQIIATKDAMVRLGTEGIDWLITKFGEFEDFLLGLKQTFLRIGGEIIDGLLQGLKAKWEDVKAWFTGLAGSIPGWIKDPLGIKSPSTVFAEIGQNMMQGLGQGIASETDGIQSEVQSFAQDVASTLKGVLTGAMSVREGLGGILGNLGDSLLTKGISGAFGAFGIPGFANGTNFAPGGLAMVGERGPELVSLPRGARVTPNGGGNVVTLNVNVTGARGNMEVQEMVARGVQQGMTQVRKEVPGIVVNAQKRAG